MHATKIQIYLIFVSKSILKKRLIVFILFYREKYERVETSLPLFSFYLSLCFSFLIIGIEI
jgi:hypothetical protein